MADSHRTVGTIHASNFELNVKKALYCQGVVVHWAKIISGESLIGPVTCEIDWPFRQLVMRRHTAAHLLDHCLALETSRRVETTDSWLEEPCYVGYAGSAPNEDTLRRVETHANSMVSHGAEVKIDYLTAEQGRTLLQAAPNFERLPELDEIRTVTIRGCAPIPCGGTHVADIADRQNFNNSGGTYAKPHFPPTFFSLMSTFTQFGAAATTTGESPKPP